MARSLALTEEISSSTPRSRGQTPRSGRRRPPRGPGPIRSSETRLGRCHDHDVEPAGGGNVAGRTGGAPIALDDLASLPFTTKRDLWDRYPWGMLTVPRDQVVRVHGSSGTGGRPTLVGYSRADLALWAEVCARSLGCAGASPGTIVHVAYGYGLFTGGLGLHGGAELMVCTVVPVSSGQSARQVLLLRDLGAEVLCCTPSYAARLGEVLV